MPWRLIRTLARTESLTVSGPRRVRPTPWQVAFLVSEDCKESGSLFEVGAGLFTKLRYATAQSPTLPKPIHLPTQSLHPPRPPCRRPKPVPSFLSIQHSWQRTKGAVFRLDQTFTPGAVAAKWAQVRAHMVPVLARCG